MVRHETPDWMDDELDRMDINWDDFWQFYLASTGLSRSMFWTAFFGRLTNRQKFKQAVLDETKDWVLPSESP